MEAESGYVVRQRLGRHPIWPQGGPLLGRLDVELTERCNNNCVHCYINRPESDGRAKARELLTREWQRILGEAAALGALSVRFTGGEPLLREDFPDLYLFARRLGLRVILFTNARLITPELAGLLARVPPLEKVEITVYGMHPASYEVVSRAPGSYAQFRHGVELLLAAGVPFLVKGTQLPPTRDEREEFEAWAATLPGMDGTPGYVGALDARGRRDSAARNRLIVNLRVSPTEWVRFLARRPERYRRDMAEFCSRFLGPGGDRLFDCGAGQTVSVDAYGTLQPCMTLRDPALAYDLSNGSLREALTDVFPRLRDMRATNPQYLARCARCFLKGVCEQCPAKSWAEHGTLDSPVEYLCEMAHEQARYLGLLAEGERAWEVSDGAERVRKMDGGNDGIGGS